MEFNHISVLLDETIQSLDIKENGIYVDCTAGGGGHSSAILKALGDGRLIAFDQDPDAIEVLNERLGADRRVTIVRSNFENLRHLCRPDFHKIPVRAKRIGSWQRMRLAFDIDAPFITNETHKMPV